MATINFAAAAGTTVSFNPLTDVLAMPSGTSATALIFSAVDGDLVVALGGQQVRLAGISLAQLRGANFTNISGSLRIGDETNSSAADDGANLVTGTAGSDQLIGLGGADTLETFQGEDVVQGGEGDDVISAGTYLSTNDRFDGGAGTDTLLLSGTSSSDMTLGSQHLSNIERVAIGTGNLRVATADGAAAAGQILFVDASGQAAGSSLRFNGAAETDGRFDVTGGAGADSIRGGAGADVLRGGDGADTLAGGPGGDALNGGAGDDVFLIARPGATNDSPASAFDTITDFQGAGAIGGDLIDLAKDNSSRLLAYNGARATSWNGSGSPIGIALGGANDGYADAFYSHINGSTWLFIDTNDDGVLDAGDQVVALNSFHALRGADFTPGFALIRGSDANDSQIGTIGAETIMGFGGDDTLAGNEGNDTVRGGEGNDSLAGDAGADNIGGEAGQDTLLGGLGGDSLGGGEGNDSLDGGEDNDTLEGGLGNDQIAGGQGADSLKGDTGADTLRGDADNDRIDGGSGDDLLQGGEGADTLEGGDDNDVLQGGAAGDSLIGGQGADTLDGGEGNDTLVASLGRDVLAGGAGEDRFVVSNITSPAATPNLIQDFQGGGSTGGDVIQLLSNGSLPLAWYGYKSFFFDGTFGNGGVQFPLAGDGLADAIWDYDAGTGRTRIAIDIDDNGVFGTNDLLLYIQGQHTLSYSDFADSFAVIRGGVGDDVIIGETTGDTIYGMEGHDLLDGRGGPDSLLGGEGNDTLLGDLGNDTLRGDVGADSLAGGVNNDYLTGGAENDTLDGGSENDSLYGGDGNDQLTGGTASDYLYGEAGADTLQDDDGNDTLGGGAGEDLLVGGQGNDSLDGDDDNDRLNGGAGNDTLVGGAGADTLVGEGGNDALNGSSGNDLVQAGEGADTLYSAGADTLEGGAGADNYRLSLVSGTPGSTLTATTRILGFEQGVDQISIDLTYYGRNLVFNAGAQAAGVVPYGGDGLADVFYRFEGGQTRLYIDANDDGKIDGSDLVVEIAGEKDLTTADFAAIFRVARGTPNADTLTGGDLDDTIYGVAGDDLMLGGLGADVLQAGEGNDTLNGGDGADDLYGSVGNDSLVGGIGADELIGGDGNDTLLGGNDNDSLTAGSGSDTLQGGLGNDYLYGNAGQDTLEGEDGNDSLYGDDDNDLLRGGIGNDQLSGDGGNDRLEAGDGNDSVYGHAGQDTLVGGNGNDVVDGGGDADSVHGGAGADTLYASGADTLIGAGGADVFGLSIVSGTPSSSPTATARITDFVRGQDVFAVNTTYYARPLAFNAGAVASGVPFGGDGFADVFYRHENGQTTLLMDLNDDGIISGSDFMLVLDGLINLTAADFSGLFRWRRGTAAADNLTGGAGNDSIYGQGGNDRIAGDLGADELFGGAGTDTLRGEDGNDSLYGDADNDRLFGGVGNDQLTGGDGADTLDGEAGNDHAYGGLLNDLLRGGEGADYLRGDAGADTLLGGEANDTLAGGDDGDSLDGAAGNDTLDGDAGADVLLGGDGNDSLSGYTGRDTLAGGDGNDLLSGGQEADLVTGGIGSDTLYSDGADTLTGGVGADLFSLSIVSGTPGSHLLATTRVTDFEKGQDLIAISTTYFTRPLAFNAGAVASGVPFGGDGFADVFYTHSGDRTRLMIDINDDGVINNSDLVVDFDGTVDFATSDFSYIFGVRRGTEDADTIVGDDLPDTIRGQGGADMLLGNGGQDDLSGGAGADTLSGGDANDQLRGDAGADQLDGGNGRDTLDGGEDADTMEGGADIDHLYGGAGNDLLRGGFGNDNLYGGSNADTLEGGADNDELTGEDGDDVLAGQDGADTLQGGAGHDNISGGASADRIVGGAGNDTIDGGTEVDTVVFSAAQSAYEITFDGEAFIVRHLNNGTDGTDRLTNVELFQFAGGSASRFVSVSDGVVVEGDNGQKYMAFKVGLTGAATTNVTVAWATGDGTATAGQDYQAGSGTLTFAPGETVKTVMVPIYGDTVNEADETLNLTLSNASGAIIADGVGVGRILNDDVRVSLSGDVSETEGNSGATRTLTFTVTLDAAPVAPVTVAWRTVDGMAVAGQDYISAAGTLQFGAGETSRTITITLLGDALSEGNETFLVELLTPSGAILGDNPDATVTIQDDDVNTAPVASSFAGSIAQNAVLALNLTASDAEGPVASFTLAALPTGGKLYLDAARTMLAQAGVAYPATGDALALWFVPNEGFTGDVSFAFTASDGSLASPQAVVSVTVTPPEPIRGDEAANVLTGTGVAELLEGLGGADTLHGGGGADTLDGGTGADSMAGGSGADIYIVDDAADVVVELAGQGVDTVFAWASHTLGGNVEHLVLSGDGAFNGTGNGQANRIEGNAANNRLYGSAGSDTLLGNEGADTLDGGRGDDSLVGGTGNDVYVVDSAGDVLSDTGGTEVVRASVSWTLSADFEQLVLLGSAAIDGIGSDQRNVMTGNGAANRLEGRGGYDVLSGGGGADTLQGGTASDSLAGGAGDDLLDGEQGSDTLFGGEGADIFRFGHRQAGASDVVTDFTQGEDIVWLSRAAFSSVLALGALDPAHFALDAATTAGPQFVYNTATGVLSWDGNGTGEGSGVVIATFATKPALTASDFLVVG